MSPRKWRFRIEDMLNAARKIAAYVEGLTFEDFARDEKTFDAVLRQLTILGEAATHVPEEIISRTSDIPWFEMRGMRNIVVHEYFGVNSRIVWETATKNIPALLPLLERLLADVSLGNQDDGLP
jgi:uncharacterized protein with HEPN domain